MGEGIAKLSGMHADFGTAPDADGTRVPYVLMRLQATLEGATINLPPFWMTADHARALADRLTLAADHAGKPPAGSSAH